VKRLATCIAIVAGLWGCAEAPPRTEVPHCPGSDGLNRWQCFSQVQKAAPGEARLYVFRPDFNDLQEHATPVLTIDDSFELSVPLLSYSFIDLPMGHHTYRLTPGPTDSPIWNLQGAFDISAEGPFFLAVWNADLSTTSSPDYGAYGKDVAKATAVGLVTAALTGGLAVFPVATMHSKSDGRTEARIELVTEEQALEFLRQCELSPTKKVQSRAATDAVGILSDE